MKKILMLILVTSFTITAMSQTTRTKVTPELKNGRWYFKEFDQAFKGKEIKRWDVANNRTQRFRKRKYYPFTINDRMLKVMKDKTYSLQSDNCFAFVQVKNHKIIKAWIECKLQI